MSEENKIFDDLDLTELPKQPKRRGRKKKADATVTNGENNEKNDNATVEKETDIEEKLPACGDGEDKPITLDITASDEPVEPITLDEPTNGEPVLSTDAEADISVSSVAEEALEGGDAYTGIEHFSDTLEIRYLSDEVEQAYTPKKEEDEQPISDEEYENLKIFEDVEPTEKREPKQKRVREVSPDYKEYNAEKPRHVDTRFDFIELFVYTLVVIMLITTFFFKHSKVEGWSMQGTLSDQDHIIISDFLYTPKQYDIVVIHDPEVNPDALVKRIIALGGQTVRLEYRLDKEKSSMDPFYKLEIFVDGQKVEEKQCNCHSRDDTLHTLKYGHKLTEVMPDMLHPERYEYVIYEYVVPEGEVYLLGDHRKNSSDSRIFGSVDENKILGRLLFRFFPFDSFGTVE